MEKITASMASIPTREQSLRHTIKSVVGQVDALNVYLNGYANIPGFLKDPKISVFTSQEFGDLGASGKFFKASEVTGYHFTIDDDIIYPRDYIGVMIDKIEEYDRDYCIGAHGAILVGNISSYYQDRILYHFRGTVTEDYKVHILGTGCLAYHSDTIKVSIDDFKKPNMADIIFGKLAQKQKVGMLCITHKAHWIRTNHLSNQKESIFSTYVDNDKEQTTEVKKIKNWKLNKKKI